MMTTTYINRDNLRWARERWIDMRWRCLVKAKKGNYDNKKETYWQSVLEPELHEKYKDWEKGELIPTENQLEELAEKFNVALGYFLIKKKLSKIKSTVFWINTYNLRWARKRWVYEKWSYLTKEQQKKYDNEEENYWQSELKQKLHKIHKNYENWENKRSLPPTWKQLEGLAKKFHIGFGYLFIDRKLTEEDIKLPITDFRTYGNKIIRTPTPALLDVIRDARSKQRWYRDYKLGNGYRKFSGLAGFDKDLKEADDDLIANDIREFLDLDKKDDYLDSDKKIKNLIETVVIRDIMVMRNGCVGNNTRRPLNVEEFCGFALYDTHAPLIFINGALSKQAQIFTLAHELAHLQLRHSGLVDMIDVDTSISKENFSQEKRCNRIAGKVLLPDEIIRRDWELFSGGHDSHDYEEICKKIVNRYKISFQVVLIRAYLTGLIEKEDFNRSWKVTSNKKERTTSQKGGGDFWATLPYRLGGRPFINAAIDEFFENRMLYTDTRRLLGLDYEQLKSKKLEKMLSKI
ncbi:hypothetical protein COTS27_00803 [Spirochaetota bacterium]|nr:hypothetical protein COTS27_00803 [Spirochaetota bacterium]